LDLSVKSAEKKGKVKSRGQASDLNINQLRTLRQHANIYSRHCSVNVTSPKLMPYQYPSKSNPNLAPHSHFTHKTRTKTIFKSKLIYIFII